MMHRLSRVPRMFSMLRQTRVFPQLQLFSVQSTASTESPMDLVNSIPPIEVDGDIAICDGGKTNFV
jgi:hypothetical protein